MEEQNKQMRSVILSFIFVMVLSAITHTAYANSKTRIIKTGDVVMGIAVDLNRNGEVSFDSEQPRVDKDGEIVETESATDKTHPSLPYRFWINNDYDVVSNFGSIRLDKTDCIDFNQYNSGDEYQQGCEQWDEDPVQKTNLTMLNKIESNRDLEDFSPLDININVSKDIKQYYWQLKAVGISINIFSRYLDLGVPEAHAYIFDTPTTIIQTAQANVTSTGHFMTLIAGDSPKKLTDKQINDFFDATGRGAFIFEGMSACETEVANCYIELSLRNKKDNESLKVDKVYLDLHDIKDFYQHITAGTAQDKGDTYQPEDDFGDYDVPIQNAYHAKYYGGINLEDSRSRKLNIYDSLFPASDITKDLAVFVHGWRVLDAEKISFAETSFKRLYWSGYKSQFTAFTWPTGWFEKPAYAYGSGVLPYVLGNERNYDISELVARQVGADFKTWIESVSSPNKHVIAHSMGNVVVSEALKYEGTGNIIASYTASQAATAAGSYDSNAFDINHKLVPVPKLCSIPTDTQVGAEQAWRCYNSDNDLFIPETKFDMPPDMYRNNLIVSDNLGNLFVEHGKTDAETMKENGDDSHYFKNISDHAGRILNYYNIEDAALTAWEFNQLTKPDYLDGPTWDYSNTYLEQYSNFEAEEQLCLDDNQGELFPQEVCDADTALQALKPDENGVYRSLFKEGGDDVLYTEINKFRILAHVIPARTEPLGQVNTGGEIGNSPSMSGFTTSNQDHSAPFHGYYSEISAKDKNAFVKRLQRASYWNTVLDKSIYPIDKSNYTGLQNNIPISD